MRRATTRGRAAAALLIQAPCDLPEATCSATAKQALPVALKQEVGHVGFNVGGVSMKTAPCSSLTSKLTPPPSVCLSDVFSVHLWTDRLARQHEKASARGSVKRSNILSPLEVLVPVGGFSKETEDLRLVSRQTEAFSGRPETST